MKRWYLVAAVALWPVAELRAQEGLAPTAPVVPAPVLKNGAVLAPADGTGWGSNPRTFSVARWSPFRNPATASTVEPTAPVHAQHQQPLPPLPAGTSAPAPDANCGPAACGHASRDRSCWARIKALLCYSDSPTDLPKCRPTPYVTPLMGMFPCSAVAGCSSTCGGGYGYASSTDPIRYGVPNDRQPPAYIAPQPVQPQPMQPMPQPVAPAKTAGPVVMPPRGMQGSAVQPTWQGRVVPESAVTAKPAAKPAPASGPIVPTGFKYPAPAQK